MRKSENANNLKENSSKSSPDPPSWKGKHNLTLHERKNAKIAFAIASLGIIGFLAQLAFFLVRFSIDDWLAVLTYWIVLIMPGYLTNAGMLIWGGGKPLDGGKSAKDGRRIFGPGKTVRGFILGPLAFGIPLGLIVHGTLILSWNTILESVTGFLANPNINYSFYDINPALLWEDLGLYLLGTVDAAISPRSIGILLLRVIGCSFGAAVGDLAGSWLKRRKNLPRGSPYWGVDQLDFLVGCLLFIFPLLLLGGFHLTKVGVHIFLMLIIITPSITVIANSVSFLLGYKKVPW